MEHIIWDRGTLRLLDQRALPDSLAVVEARTAAEAAAAIRDMVVRGAPAIGIAAAYGVALAARGSQAGDVAGLLSDLEAAEALLKSSRPTAVNLAWAVDRMLSSARRGAAAGASVPELRLRLEAEAVALHREDVAACRAIGKNGLALVPERARILTHCNAGALATGGYGTALGIVRAAHEAGRLTRVYADETRPYLQGARLTAWELQRDGIPVAVLCDNTAGTLLARGEVDLIVVGADRIAANGDTANKVGTYPLAVLAKHHQVPFVVAAPTSTFDLKTPDRRGIPIEERPGDEVALVGGRRVVPEGVPVLHPAFDVTPAALITAIVTERGVLSPVTAVTVGGHLREPRP